MNDKKWLPFLRLTIIVSFVVVTLFGCGVYTHAIAVGKARPATDANNVTAYLDPPSQYETVGLIESCCNEGITTQKKIDVMMNDVKSQAAKLGANGILLIQPENKMDIEIDNGTLKIQEASSTKWKWRAIYVTSE